MYKFINILQTLHEKLGPILIQLPPKYSQDNFSILNEFLKTLSLSYLYAIEFRNKSWYNQKTSKLLGKYHVCWVSNDYPNLPKEITLTSDFIYIRWIGINGMYHHHSYERVDKNDEFHWWLEKILSYSNQISTLLGFFNNDYTGFAPGTCTRFKQFSGIQGEVENLPYQSSLF